VEEHHVAHPVRRRPVTGSEWSRSRACVGVSIFREWKTTVLERYEQVLWK